MILDMLTKKRRVLQEIAPHLDEGLLLISKNLEIEVLSDITFRYLQLPSPEKKFFYSDQCNCILLTKIISAFKEKKIQAQLEHGDITYSLEIVEIEKNKKWIAIIKDSTNCEKMLHMGKEFVGNASHELRTPITIIKGFTEMLLETENIERSMQLTILQKISASCQRMEHLVNHLLRLTDLENSDLEGVIPVNIHELIEEISYQVLSIYPNFQIEHLRKEEDLYAFVEPDLIELVMTNLCKNSVKYSRDEKVITIQVDKQEKSVYIKIIDKGIGIPTDDLEKIFDRFYTVDKAHCRKLGGAGLGLSIVKLIVEMHGGKIYATSNLGIGTTMHLFLPYIDESIKKMSRV